MTGVVSRTWSRVPLPESAALPSKSILKRRIQSSLKFTSRTENLEKMGCKRSKLNNKICDNSETADTHKKIIKENGIDSYNRVMGFAHEESGHKMDDHSSTFNVGLLNLDNKSKSETENEFHGLSFKEYVEIALAILIIMYAGRTDSLQKSDANDTSVDGVFEPENAATVEFLKTFLQKTTNNIYDLSSNLIISKRF